MKEKKEKKEFKPRRPQNISFKVKEQDELMKFLVVITSYSIHYTKLYEDHFSCRFSWRQRFQQQTVGA